MISVVVVLRLCFPKASRAAYRVMRDPAMPAAMPGLDEKLHQSKALREERLADWGPGEPGKVRGLRPIQWGHQAEVVQKADQ